MKQTKILGLTMILLFGALVLRGQGWDKIYPSNLYATAQTNANALAEAKNGDFIAAEALLTGLNLMRVDKDGNFLWQKKYTFPIYAHGIKVSIVCLLDGSVLVKEALKTNTL